MWWFLGYLALLPSSALLLRKLPLNVQIFLEGLVVFSYVVIFGNFDMSPSLHLLTLFMSALPLLYVGEETGAVFPRDALTFTAVVVMFPLAEEVAFRWWLLRALNFNTLIDSLIFSAFHLLNVVSGLERPSLMAFAARFTVGWVLAEAVKVSGSVFPSFLYHSLANLIAFSSKNRKACEQISQSML